MRRAYHYLAASLPDLYRGRTSGAGSLEEYLRFCEEVLHPEDRSSLKQLFLFNDLRNAVEYVDKDSPFVGPSFYTPEELLTLRREPDPEAAFVGRYLATREERLYPAMVPIDEAITLFYEEIDRVEDEFIRAYFLHELELRNIATALELRAAGFPVRERLIPLGVAYERLTAEDEGDWGLSEEFPFIRTLLPLYADPDLTARESALDEVRWAWCDEAVAEELFTFHAIAAYGMKLMTVERWSHLDEEAGNELFMELLGTVQRSVRFAIEFAHLTEEEREERRRQMEAGAQPEGEHHAADHQQTAEHQPTAEGGEE